MAQQQKKWEAIPVALVDSLYESVVRAEVGEDNRVVGVSRVEDFGHSVVVLGPTLVVDLNRTDVGEHVFDNDSGNRTVEVVVGTVENAEIAVLEEVGLGSLVAFNQSLAEVGHILADVVDLINHI